MNCQQAYDELTQRSRERWNIGSIRGLVSWDQQVNMPPKGVAHRAEMLSYLAQEIHRKSTEPRIGELLAEAEGANGHRRRPPTCASGAASTTRRSRYRKSWCVTAPN